MIYDAADYAEAIEAPVLRIDGKEWTGRLLSIDDVAPYQGRLSKVGGEGDGAIDGPALLDLIREITDLVFPIVPTWKVWKWRPPASWFLLRLPPAQMVGLFMGFLEPQIQVLTARNLGRKTADAPA